MDGENSSSMDGSEDYSSDVLSEGEVTSFPLRSEGDIFSFSDLQTEADVTQRSDVRKKQTTSNIDSNFPRSVDTITDTCISVFEDQSVFEEVFGRKLCRQDSFPEIGCDEDGDGSFQRRTFKESFGTTSPRTETNSMTSSVRSSHVKKGPYLNLPEKDKKKKVRKGSSSQDGKLVPDNRRVKRRSKVPKNKRRSGGDPTPAAAESVDNLSARLVHSMTLDTADGGVSEVGTVFCSEANHSELSSIDGDDDEEQQQLDHDEDLDPHHEETNSARDDTNSTKDETKEVTDETADDLTQH